MPNGQEGQNERREQQRTTEQKSWIETFIERSKDRDKNQLRSPHYKIESTDRIVGPMTWFQIYLWDEGQKLRNEVIDLEAAFKKSIDEDGKKVIRREMLYTNSKADLIVALMYLEFEEQHGKPEEGWTYGVRRGENLSDGGGLIVLAKEPDHGISSLFKSLGLGF